LLELVINLPLLFKVVGHDFNEAISWPTLFFIDKLRPNLEKTLDADLSFNLSAKVNAQLFLYTSITFQRLDLKDTKE